MVGGVTTEAGQEPHHCTDTMPQRSGASASPILHIYNHMPHVSSSIGKEFPALALKMALFLGKWFPSPAGNRSITLLGLCLGGSTFTKHENYSGSLLLLYSPSCAAANLT
ncbi:hypothetical protein E2C01_014806 [Portunus trituberculatus]|uniref:Uncharacterized protein n=1 Tax=Portunus trituberculatus TaxID=210409 RepID=A0A5B7DL29_PORTR|nr:hypothetical protein [Portunus trituberculatus]